MTKLFDTTLIAMTQEQKKKYHHEYYLRHKEQSLAKQREQYRKNHPNWINDRPNSYPITKEHIIKFVYVDSCKI